MTGELVLSTGGTGHIGFATLREALQKGYKVRAAIRRESSIAEIKAAKSIQPYLDNLSFVTVPDITVDRAFDEALKDVVYVLHHASPLARASEDYEAEIIQPAIHGTLSILKSALKYPAIKRIVITSSQGAVMPEQSGEVEDQKIWTADNIVPDPQGPYPHYFAAYGACKMKAYNATLDFIATKSPHYSITNVMPSLVMGKNELATTTKAAASGSNMMLMSVLLGNKSPFAIVGTTVHIDDVAFVHAKALDPSVPGGSKFACNCNGVEGIVWDEACEIVKKHFPEAVKEGILKADGSCPSKKAMFDARPTEEALGFKFKGWEEQVVSQASWYIEVAKMEKGSA